jgi:drug/metabolite transporter (DMT)-like permease
MTAGGLAVYTIGARSVPAAIIALLSLIEVVLGPTWVWIVLDEVPHTVTIVGGALVLSAIAGQALIGMTGRRGQAAQQQA